MKVFLTGGRGMVGRAIRDHISANAHTIVAPTSAELDLMDRTQVLSTLSKEQPDLIIHAAGRVGGIQANKTYRAAFLTENMGMGVNIVTAAAEVGVPKLLNLGSSCMYPHDAPNPLQEQSLGKGELEPTNEGYGLAKLAVARLCSFVSDENADLDYKTLMPCNLYGLHDKFDPKVSHLLPAIIRKIHEAKVNGDKTVEIWGDGTARREFMFSGDLADGIWTSIDRFNDLPGFMNIGIGSDHSINEFYQAAANVIGWQGEFVHDLSRPTGMQQKLLDVRLQQEFGWAPNTQLADGIQKTYQHFLELLERGHP